YAGRQQRRSRPNVAADGLGRISERFGHARGEIGKHAARAGALEGDQALDHRLLAVEPTVLRRCHDHRIFARYLIGEGRHGEGVFHAPQNVEVGHTGLDHDHIGPLGNIKFDLAQRLVAVGRVHLIRALVANQVRGRAYCVAEWTVEGRGIFGRVGHDRNVGKAGAVETRADRPDAPVPHVRRGDDVAAGLRLDQRLLHQDFHRFVVEYDAVAQEAVVAVAGVGIEGDIAKDTDARHRTFNGAYGATHQVVWINRFAAGLVPLLRVGIRK